MEMDIKEEQKTEGYKETVDIDIENINTIEKIHKVYTKIWGTIYEVIQQYVFDEIDIFPDDFIKIVRIMQIQLIIYQLR